MNPSPGRSAEVKRNCVVIGAGAAGLMAAIEAGKRGRSVAVLERSEKFGKKIRISGGGRCNFTNLFATFRNFLSQNPDFCKSALAGFTPRDFVGLVEKHGVGYFEKKLGQLFCSKTSDDILRMLEAEFQSAGAEIYLNCAIDSVTKNGSEFEVQTSRGVFRSQSLVVASGGLSIPKMGATPFGHQLAEQFGLGVVACRPALVPLVWSRDDLKLYGDLTGLSVNASVQCGRGIFKEALLFTHRGLSGPAILQISSYWQAGMPVLVDLLPDHDILEELFDARKHMKDLAAVLASHWPRRLAQKWRQLKTPSKPFAHFTDAEIRALSDGLHRWEIVPQGTEGYEKAEVTAGGVDTRELSSKTMEAKKVPGLYFVGEVVDVTGQLGGFNFQWAWSSGFAAGQVA